MKKEKQEIQAKVDIVKATEEEAKPTRFGLKEFFYKYSAIITLVFTLSGVIIAILSFAWIIHGEISELNSRLGNVEGKLEIILEDRKEILDSYKGLQSASSVKQLKE